MATTLPILDAKGDEVGSADLDPKWLEREKGEQAVHDAVVAYLAAHRSGSASTKTRAELRGGGAKPYRQKGTGRARAGSRRSPLWRGGGVIFGPKPRSFAKGINRKVRLLALRRTFADRVDGGDVILVDELKIEEPKTKLMVELLRAVGAGEEALVLVADIDANLRLAARNLPGVQVMKALNVNAYYMLTFKKIVITRAALEVLGNHLQGREKAK